MRLIQLFKKELSHEARSWVRDELVSEEQANSILARYGTSLTDDTETNSFGYYLLMSLGALFIGLALILIVSHNWDEIPRAVRTSSLLLLTLVTNAIGIKRFLSERTRAGIIWLFFGGISYGASIMLIAQIYHLGEHFPDGIFWWAMGILPLVIFTQSRLLAALSLGLASIWLGVESGEDFFPALYPLFVSVTLWLILFQARSRLLFIACVVGTMVWMNLGLAWMMGNGHHFDPVAEQLPLSLAIGLFINGVAWRLMRSDNSDWREYGLVTHIWLLRAAIVTLLGLSFEGVWQGYTPGSDWLSVVSVISILVAGVLAIVLCRESGRYASWPVMMVTGYLTFSFMLVTWFGHLEIIAAIATNLMLLLMGILLIRRGIDQSETHYFYTGIVVLLLTAFLRYFDLIGDYIGGALLFLVAAGILMVAAKYWKRRVSLISLKRGENSE
ncbi:DUF2157 domain-containing protein [Shewanella atlantica]|uniref:DUF2157 domain-containing protein n=1 Tax=Shewanella atlantica TaxID=271099 RepID=UPI00373626F6